MTTKHGFTAADWRQLKQNRIELYRQQESICMVCGQFVSGEIDAFSFPHLVSKSKMDKSEKLTRFLFVHPELHIWEHTAAKNLEQNPCVKLFIEKYFNGRKKFWQKFIEMKKLFEYEL